MRPRLLFGTACSSASTPVFLARVPEHAADAVRKGHVNPGRSTCPRYAIAVLAEHEHLRQHIPPTLLLLPDEPAVQPAPSFLLHFPN